MMSEPGLAERDDTIALKWMDGRSSELGKTSVLIRVTTVSSGIDHDDITDCEKCESMLEAHPGRARAEAELRSMRLSL